MQPQYINRLSNSHHINSNLKLQQLSINNVKSLLTDFNYKRNFTTCYNKYRSHNLPTHINALSIHQTQQYKSYNTLSNYSKLNNKHHINQSISTSLYTITRRTQYNRHYNNRQDARNNRGNQQPINPEIILLILRYIVRFLPRLWRSSTVQNLRYKYPKLFYGLLIIPSIGSSLFLVSNLETVPYSNRLHLTFLNTQSESLLGQSAYTEVIQKEHNRIVDPSSSTVQQCQEVVNNIVSILKQDNTCRQDMKFNLTVIDSDVANAFVLPNGSIFVYTGIFKMTQNTAGLALVLGHECSHAIARHAVEKIGITGLSVLTYEFLMGLRDSSSSQDNGLISNILLGVAGFIAQAGVPLAHSRKLETEADKIGVTLAARAGYNPQIAKLVWHRMQESEQNSQQPFEWLSTHPSHETRIKNVDKWAAEAQPLYEQAIQQRQQLRLPIPNSKQTILYHSSLPHYVVKKYDELNQTALTSFQASSLTAGPLAQELNLQLRL